MENLVIFFNSEVAQTIIRIILSVCFGALIGLEREHAHRPAGLRTHILVCLGSCLVMLTSEFVYETYHQFSPNMDVNRLGAQVISGIGFLGAGTIIRNGSSIKGLTTAASIWAVACIGLATGVGYYLGATVVTITIFIALSFIKSSNLFHNNKKVILSVSTTNKDVSTQIEEKFFASSIKVNKISISSDNEDVMTMTFSLLMNDSVNFTPVVNEIYSMPGVSAINSRSIETPGKDD